MSKGKDDRYLPVGYCIYCGRETYSDDENNAKLTNEHIIPDGLGGQLVLPEASCKRCQEMTRDFETRALRGALRKLRIDLGLTSGKQPVKTLPIFGVNTTVHGGDLRKELDLAEYPHIAFLFYLNPPGILQGLSENEDLGIPKWWIKWWGFDPGFWKRHDLKDFATPDLSGHAFCQMLAKIAYSYAVAEFGLSAFTTHLLDIIEGPPVNNTYVIGGELSELPASEYLNEIAHEIIEVRGTRYIVVRIRLFANLGAPVYRVVAGFL